MMKYALLCFLAVYCKSATDALEQGKKLFLIDAVQQRNVEMVQWLINEEAFLDVQDDLGKTPLMHAASFTNGIDMVLMLLNAGAKLNMKDNEGYTVLHVASENGSLDILTHLYRNSSTGTVTDNQGRTLLHVATRRGNEDIVDFLTSQGENPLTKDKNGLTAVHIAAMEGKTQFLSLWSDMISGLDREPNGTTPLMLAVLSGQENSAQELIKAGVNVNCQDVNLSTPLHAAASSGNLKLIKLLLDNNATIDSKDLLGRTPLFRATEKGHLNCINYLIQMNSSKESVDLEGNTLLHAAATSGVISIFDLFLNTSHSIDVRNRNGSTPIVVASGKDHTELVNRLIDLGADINLMDENYGSFLTFFASSGNLNILKAVKEKNIPLNYSITGARKATPLHLAARIGKSDLISFIIEEIVKNNYLKLNDSESRLKRAAALKTPLCPSCYKFVTNMKDEDGKTPTYYAAELGNLDALRTLIMYGGNISIPDVNGQLPLHAAAHKGQKDDVLNFIVLGTENLDAEDKTGKTPLFLSAEAGHLETLKHLINIGANITTKDEEGWTIMHTAAANGQLNIVSNLVEYKYLLNCTDSKGRTPAWYALSRNKTETMWRLHKAHAVIKPELNIFEAVESGQWGMATYIFNECDSPTSTDKEGRTLMHIAASKGYSQIIRELSKYQCLVNRRDNEGKTPAWYSVMGEHWDSLELLQSLQGTIEPRNFLFQCIKEGKLESAKYLIRNGADVNTLDKHGNSLIMEAVKQNRIDILNYLIEAGANVKGLDEGKPYLRTATELGYCELAKILIQKGISYSHLNNYRYNHCYNALYNYRYG